MLSLAYRSQKSLINHLAGQALALSREIAESSLVEHENTLSQALKVLTHNRRVLLLGRENSGKSTLLSALINEPLIPKVISRERVIRWRTTACEPESSPARYLMRDDLASLEFIDTTDHLLTGVVERLPELVAQSDIAIAVVNSRDLEDADFWIMLRDLLALETRCQFAIVPTHIDTLDAKQTLRLKGAIQDGIHDYVKTPIPYFPLDTREESDELTRLNAYIQEILDGEQGMHRDLVEASNACQALLQKQANVLQSRQAARSADTGFLRSVDEEINRFQERQLAGVEPLIESYVNDLQEISEDIEDELSGYFGSLFIPSDLLVYERVAPEIEAEYYLQLNAALLERQKDSDQQFLLACKSHWTSVEERMRETLHCNISSFQSGKLLHELAELHRQLFHTVYETLQQNQFRHKLHSMLTPLIAKIYPLFILICLMTAVAGGLGFYEYHFFGLLCIIAAGFFWLLASLVQQLNIRATSRALKALLIEVNHSISQPLASALAELVLSRVAAYRQLYKEPRELLVEQEKKLIPLMQEQRKLYQQFCALRRMF